MSLGEIWHVAFCQALLRPHPHLFFLKLPNHDLCKVDEHIARLRQKLPGLSVNNAQAAQAVAGACDQWCPSVKPYEGLILDQRIFGKSADGALLGGWENKGGLV